MAASVFEIVAREDFSDVTYLLEIRHPLMAEAARAGQFVIVMAHEHGERIPLTIADFDRDKGTITLVIQAVGKTTREMQQICKVGTALHAVVGPMGMPSPVSGAKKVLCVGGGLGVAPIFPQARAFKAERRVRDRRHRLSQQGAHVLDGQVRASCDELIVCTDDGSAGIKGTGHRGHQARHREAPRYRRMRGNRPAGDDERLRRGHACAQDQDDGEPQSGDGRRHRDVRRLPGQGRRRGEVRLRRRTGLRRPPGRFRRPDVAAAALRRGGEGRARALVGELPDEGRAQPGHACRARRRRRRRRRATLLELPDPFDEAGG